MLEKVGCQLLMVYGCIKEQKGFLLGVVFWEYIKVVWKVVVIFVFVNGNIQCLQDVECCFWDMGVQGVMSVEGNLYNFVLFEGWSFVVWELVEEYLDIVWEYFCFLFYVWVYFFKLWYYMLQVYQEL